MDQAVMDRTITSDDWERRFSSVWAELTRLLERSGAATAVLLDTTGNAITYAGDDPDFDLSAFSSLAVADFLASKAMAALLHEDGMRWVVHQGEHGGIVLAPLHAGIILAAIFDRRTTLGLVRHEMRKNLSRLAEATRPLLGLVDRSFAEFGTEDAGLGSTSTGAGERDPIGEGLARLFGPS